MEKRALNEIVDSISFEIGTFFADNLESVDVGCEFDFGYYEDEDELVWSIISREDLDALFAKFFEEELGCMRIHPFVYSLFHEYGHKVTLGNFCQEERDKYNRDNIANADVEDFELRNYTYWRFPIEVAASRWAVNYINTHYDMIIDWLNDKICPLMEELEQCEELDVLIDEYNHNNIAK